MFLPKSMTVLFTLALAIFATSSGVASLASGPTCNPLPSGDLKPVEGGEFSQRYAVLTWSCVEGADGYIVYRAENPSGPWIEVGGRSDESMRIHPYFVDLGVSSAGTYYYRVAAVDALGDVGSPSQPVTIRVPETFVASSGPKRMICSLSDQRIYFYEGDQLVNVMRCSTGLHNSTPTGNFRILAHYRTHMGIGGAVCDYWMSFTSSHGMHSWPRGSRVNYENGLGAPASHGCIRLHPLEAYWPYNWAPNGTPLTVTYASLARRIVSGCHVSVGAPRASREWYFAEGYTGGGFDTYLLLSNPGSREAQVEISFFRSDGSVVRRIYAVAAESRFTLSVDRMEGMEGVEFGTKVSASVEVVAERAMYFTMGKRDDGTVSIGSPELSKTWYFAEGYTGGNFETYLLILNPSRETGRAHLTFFPEGGAECSFAVDLPPGARRTVKVDDLPGMEGRAFALMVNSSLPIVAERAEYFDKGYIRGGHASIGVTGLSKEWHFAEGCTRQFFEEYILIGNPWEGQARAQLHYRLPEGSLAAEIQVPPRSRVTLPVHSQPGLSGRDVGLSIYSDKPLVAERAMYYDLDSHRGGHASIGAPLPSRTWHFAEGYTDGAFDCYLLVANMNPEPADLTFDFFREDGKKITYRFQAGGGTRFTLHVDSLPGLERTAFSLFINSNRPVVAERATYFVMALGY